MYNYDNSIIQYYKTKRENGRPCNQARLRRWMKDETKQTVTADSSGNAQTILLSILRRRIKDINRVHLLPLPGPSTTDDPACPVVHACTYFFFYYSSVQAGRILRIPWNQSFTMTGGAALWRRRDKNKKEKKAEKETRTRELSSPTWYCTGSGTGHKITMDPAMLDRHLRASLGRQACFKCAVREVMEQFLL